MADAQPFETALRLAAPAQDRRRIRIRPHLLRRRIRRQTSILPREDRGCCRGRSRQGCSKREREQSGRENRIPDSGSWCAAEADWPGWIRTTTAGSKDRCPAIRRRATRDGSRNPTSALVRSQGAVPRRSGHWDSRRRASSSLRESGVARCQERLWAARRAGTGAGCPTRRGRIMGLPRRGRRSAISTPGEWRESWKGCSSGKRGQPGGYVERGRGPAPPTPRPCTRRRPCCRYPT